MGSFTLAFAQLVLVAGIYSELIAFAPTLLGSSRLDAMQEIPVHCEQEHSWVVIPQNPSNSGCSELSQFFFKALSLRSTGTGSWVCGPAASNLGA